MRSLPERKVQRKRNQERKEVQYPKIAVTEGDNRESRITQSNVKSK